MIIIIINVVNYAERFNIGKSNLNGLSGEVKKRLELILDNYLKTVKRSNINHSKIAYEHSTNLKDDTPVVTKAEAKRTQHWMQHLIQHLSNMLRSFGHPVATFATSIKINNNVRWVAKQTQHVIWRFMLQQATNEMNMSFCWLFDATMLDGVVTLKTGWPNERNIGCNDVGWCCNTKNRLAKRT